MRAPLHLEWCGSKCCGEHLLKNKDGETILRLENGVAEKIDHDFKHYFGLERLGSLSHQEIKDLSEIASKKKSMNFEKDDLFLKIDIEAGDDFPFEILNDWNGVPLIVRNIKGCKYLPDSRRIIRKKGFIKTVNPVPELTYHNFEKTAFFAFFNHLGEETAVFKSGDLKKQALYIIENCQILHFAGHSEFNKEGATVFQLDGLNSVCLSGNDIASLENVPEFIWMNSCESACSGINSWAEIFLKKGCRCFIGCSSYIKDDIAEKAAAVFYKNLSIGETAGYSYHLMKKELLTAPESFFFRFYGDELFRINIVREVVYDKK